MSIKVSTFANIITNPLNIHNFVVKIPDFSYDILVSSTSFPSEKLQTVTKHFQGERIQYPTIPQIGGEWSIKLPENDDGKVKKALDKFKNNMWNQVTGTFNPQTWKTVQVYSRQLNDEPVFSVILHGVWLQGRSSVSLDNSDASKSWDWEYTFIYQWLEDVDASVVSQQLYNSY